MHPEAYNAVGRMVAFSGINAQEPWPALDVGGAYWNGSARGHLPKAKWTILELTPPEQQLGRVQGFDWEAYIVGDATTWRPASNEDYDRYPVVLCTELLEHVQDWPAVVETLSHAVTMNGIVMITCASVGRPVHGATGAPSPLEGEWYGNVEVPDLEFELLKYFKEVRVDYQYPPGDAYAFARGVR